MTEPLIIHRGTLETGPQARGKQAEAPVWLHVNVAAADAVEQLAKAAPFMDPAMVEMVCAPDTRPRVEDFGSEYVMMLRGMNLNPGAAPDDMVSLRLWSDGTNVVTAERRPVVAVRKLVTKLEAVEKPVVASEVIVRLAVQLIENMGAPIDDMLDEIDSLELALIDGSSPADFRQNLNDLRQRVLSIRRYLVPMKQAVGQLQILALDWLGEKETRQLRQAGDHLARHIEDLDAAREQLQFQHEELVAAISDRLNRNMYVLSIVAAIFLPLGFLTGLLGINVGGMPGAENATAFWWVAGGCATIAIVQLLFFRKGGWF